MPLPPSARSFAGAADFARFTRRRTTSMTRRSARPWWAAVSADILGGRTARGRSRSRMSATRSAHRSNRTRADASGGATKSTSRHRRFTTARNCTCSFRSTSPTRPLPASPVRRARTGTTRSRGYAPMAPGASSTPPLRMTAAHGTRQIRADTSLRGSTTRPAP